MDARKSGLISIRDVVAEDKNFILSTWLKGLYHGDTWFRNIPKNVFMKHYHSFLERFLTKPGLSIRVACLSEDKDVILGYAVTHKHEGDQVIDWLFVKSAWRKIGVAKSLVPDNIVWTTHLTKVGLGLLKNHPNVKFNPFVL